MALSLSIRLGLAAGIDAGGLDGGAAGGLDGGAAGGLAGAEVAGEAAGDAAGAAGLASGCAAGCAPCGLAPFAAGAGVFADADNGVVPFTTPAAESVGTFSLSFLTRIEMRRLEGSVGLFFMRSIWSA